MGTTLPNGLWLPDKDDPIDWHISPMLMGASADSAVSGRSDSVRARRTYAAGSASEAATLKANAPAEVGDCIFRTDLQQIEELKGDGWRLVRTLRGVSYTPDWPSAPYSISVGNGQQAWTYHLTHDIVTVAGVVVFGSTTSVGTSAAGIHIPLVTSLPPRLTGGDLWCSGEAVGTIGGTTYRGAVTGNIDSVIGPQPYARLIFRGPAAQGYTRPMTNSFPGTWGQGSSLAVNFQYQTY